MEPTQDPTDAYFQTISLDTSNYIGHTDDTDGVEPDKAVRYVHEYDSNATVVVLWYAYAGRACIITNGGDKWTDADDPEDALFRYCSGTMVE